MNTSIGHYSMNDLDGVSSAAELETKEILLIEYSIRAWVDHSRKKNQFDSRKVFLRLRRLFSREVESHPFLSTQASEFLGIYSSIEGILLWSCRSVTYAAKNSLS